MAYYFQCTKGIRHHMLVEMPEREAKKANRDNLDTFYSRVSAAEAHKHVLDGGIHGTGLWVDTVPTAKWPYQRRVIRKAYDENGR